MSPRSVDQENPDRLYTVRGRRTLGTDDPFDRVSLIVTERDPVPGMQSEHVKILGQCRNPMAVVEVSAVRGLRGCVVKGRLRDRLDQATSPARRSPATTTARAQLPDHDMLKQVLVGLQKL